MIDDVITRFLQKHEKLLTIALFFMLIVIVEHDVFYTILPLPASINYYLRLPWLFILIILYCFRGKVNPVLLLIAGFEFFTLFAAANNPNGNTYDLINDYILIFLVSMSIDYFSRFPKPLLIAMSVYLNLLILINLVLVIMDPVGFFTPEHWLLGYKNTHIIYFLPAICVSLLLYHLKVVGRWHPLVTAALIIPQVMLINSATTLMCSVAFAVLYFLLLYTPIRFINSFTCYAFYLALNIGIVFLRLQNLFAPLITGVLNRDLSFTLRTDTWDKTILAIKENWLFGRGFEQLPFRAANLGINYRDAHNYLLEVMYRAGIPGLLFFVLVALYICKQLYDQRSHPVGKILTVSCFALLMFITMEYFSSHGYIFLLVMLAANVSSFIPEEYGGAPA